MSSNQTNSTNQANEQRYRHLFENVPICIFVVDLRATPAVILEMNRRAELVYGYAAAELIGNPLTGLVVEESRASVTNILRSAQQGETLNTRITNRRRDGTTFPVRMIATRDPTNQDYMIVTVEDITAEVQRRSEAEAIDAERLRIAHEIHDGVAQSLAGLRFKSALWSHLAGSASPVMHAALDELQGVLTAAIDDIRRAIFALRPVDLEALGFLRALTQLVTNFGEQNQLVTQIDIAMPQDRLPAAYELPLLRMIQEGLNNTNRHARARSVWVSLSVDVAGGAALSLRDNGCGFDPRSIGVVYHAGHFGLRQMRERALHLGGTLDVHSVIGEGTKLVITLPAIIE